MNSHKIARWGTGAFGLLLAAVLLTAGQEADAQSKDKPKYTAPPSSSSSTSKPTTPPPPAKPTPAPEKPKYTAPPPVQPKETPKPAPPPEKPKYTAPPPVQPKETPKTAPIPPPDNKPKYTPAPVIVPPVSDSSKPVTGGGISDKARAAKEAQSEKKYIETQKATAPPKPKYTSPEGKEVYVRTATKDVETIRNMPSTQLKPEVRQQTMTTHVTQYHYHHDYNWYRTQPVVYVGGGYSSAFWYMMAEWDAERRARWFYNHRYDIDQSAYERGVRDAQVAAAINRMESQRVYRDTNYVDPEFKANPVGQYDDAYVEAAYNPTVVHTTSQPVDSGAALTVFLWLGGIVLFGLICWGLYALVFKVRMGT